VDARPEEPAGQPPPQPGVPHLRRPRRCGGRRLRGARADPGRRRGARHLGGHRVRHRVPDHRPGAGGRGHRRRQRGGRDQLAGRRPAHGARPGVPATHGQRPVEQARGDHERRDGAVRVRAAAVQLRGVRPGRLDPPAAEAAGQRAAAGARPEQPGQPGRAL
ncbi:MAG: hypothetical protein AVDCRST_MAG41-1848, partial [uncultured Corynebacteriales bacterium]